MNKLAENVVKIQGKNIYTEHNRMILCQKGFQIL